MHSLNATSFGYLSCLCALIGAERLIANQKKRQNALIGREPWKHSNKV
jgi:hypothetical protein